jgi:hypothetical protein
MLLLKSLTLAEQVGFVKLRLDFLEEIAVVAVRAGDACSAARFVGAAYVARAAVGEVHEPPALIRLQRAVEAGQAQTGEAAWDLARQEGQLLPLTDALALARAYAAGQTHRGESAVSQGRSHCPNAPAPAGPNTSHR